MQKTRNSNNHAVVRAQPRLHQNATEIQPYGTVISLLPLELEEAVRLEMTERLNQLLADTITLRDLYKKSHWQVAGPTFTSSIFCLINTFKNNRNWWMPSQSEFNYSVCSAIAVHTVSISCREILCWWRNARALRTTTLPVVGTFQAAGALTQQEYLVWFPMALYALECRDF